MSDTTELTRSVPSEVSRSEAGQSARRVTITPAVDIYEDTRAPRSGRPTPANLRLQHAEVREPHLARTFMLSPDFDTAKIEAALLHGMLKLTIPRRDEARPRRIKVKTG
ncbi:Hsp20/alpha crystallin family protein [Paraburkholderia terrae]|uniref:Hsp20/alpha crystallin family protein n=1 Tax=Paraburkholderia terrae TaxID=311230 RepID=UPI001EE2085D|nr:Hsp20/alpha crystallin family protein [Paraburkholderia terrae]GJH07139.1 Hsp20 family protein [Paraburkholderia terrae]